MMQVLTRLPGYPCQSRYQAVKGMTKVSNGGVESVELHGLEQLRSEEGGTKAREQRTRVPKSSALGARAWRVDLRPQMEEHIVP
jgi:hypothetical protein